MAKVAEDEACYVITDHIGTPRELISEDGRATAWRVKVGLWGDHQSVENWQSNAANTDRAPVSCRIRFQGQWADDESGIYYNRYRYYDADLMQYMSPDPIGLYGGSRPQGYVDDPNEFVDPLGLAICPNRYNNYKALREQGFSAQDAAKYSKGAGNFHAIGRHGPQVTNGQLIQRARTGRLPDTGTIPNYIQNGGSPPDATKFTSWDNYRNAYDAAHASIPAGGGPVVVDIGQPAGVGVPSINSPSRVPGVRPTGNTVTAVFNNQGQMVTMYPNL